MAREKKGNRISNMVWNLLVLVQSGRYCGGYFEVIVHLCADGTRSMVLAFQ